MSIAPFFLTGATVPTEPVEEGLDFSAIKEMMDAFDPAALLPELDTITGKIDLVARIAVMAGPIVILVLGLMYLFLAPKEANYRFGYRTWFGMGSVAAWRFTQRLAGIVLGLLGLVLTVVMFFVVNGFGALAIMVTAYLHSPLPRVTKAVRMAAAYLLKANSARGAKALLSKNCV